MLNYKNGSQQKRALYQSIFRKLCGRKLCSIHSSIQKTALIQNCISSHKCCVSYMDNQSWI